MEIHQLTYFVAVVETGGFSRAAERCHVSQPTLSQQIKKLENELGQPLFDRLGRSVALTEAGRNLLPRARSIFAPLTLSGPLETRLSSRTECEKSKTPVLRRWSRVHLESTRCAHGSSAVCQWRMPCRDRLR